MVLKIQGIMQGERERGTGRKRVVWERKKKTEAGREREKE